MPVRPSNYAQLLARYERIAAQEGVAISRYRLPGRSIELVQLILTTDGLPRFSVALDAGTHGDEPAPVYATLQFLEEERWRRWDGLKMRVLPCVNPTGFDLGTRENDQGQDVNRTFKLANSPEALAVMVLAGLEPVDLWIDAHEDPVEEGFYCFSRLDPAWDQPLVAAVAKKGPIFAKPEVDEMQVRDGIVVFDAQRQLIWRRSRERRDTWGLSGHIAVQQITQRSVTLETPGVIELETRIEMQMAAYDCLLQLAAQRRRRPDRAIGEP